MKIKKKHKIIISILTILSLLLVFLLNYLQISKFLEEPFFLFGGGIFLSFLGRLILGYEVYAEDKELSNLQLIYNSFIFWIILLYILYK